MIKTAGEFIKQAQSQINCLDVAAAKELFKKSHNAIIIDVREADSAATSKLRDSVNISRGLLEMKVQGPANATVFTSRPSRRRACSSWFLATCRR